MKKLSFLITLFILAISVIGYQKGAVPDWGLYFTGWGGLALIEFVSILKD